MSRVELGQFMAGLGEKGFRAEQVWQWLWAKGAADFGAMTNLSKELRARLGELAVIERPRVSEVRVSGDGTRKLLLELGDGALVETVLIPEEGHYTQCLSSQVGCALGCTFCSTGTLGFSRNMTQAEMCGQILVGREVLEGIGDTRPIRNLVFMGMGEPLLNFETLLRSLEIIGDEKGLGFSSRRVTVSTVGIAGKMGALGDSGLASLAVSLHAPNQELRERIMPRAAKGLPLDGLIQELAAYPLKPRQRITIEYVLLKGINDSAAQARELAKLLSPLKVKVNLIAYNASKNMPYGAPDPEVVLAFEKVLWDKGLTAILRKSRGQDIEAACGQLAAASVS